MNRRSFLKNTSLAGAGMALGSGVAEAGMPQTSSADLKTKHLIFIVNGNGARRQEGCALHFCDGR